MTLKSISRQSSFYYVQWQVIRSVNPFAEFIKKNLLVDILFK
jgi:hypothetical protein